METVKHGKLLMCMRLECLCLCIYNMPPNAYGERKRKGKIDGQKESKREWEQERQRLDWRAQGYVSESNSINDGIYPSVHVYIVQPLHEGEEEIGKERKTRAVCMRIYKSLHQFSYTLTLALALSLKIAFALTRARSRNIPRAPIQNPFLQLYIL